MSASFDHIAAFVASIVIGAVIAIRIIAGVAVIVHVSAMAITVTHLVLLVMVPQAAGLVGA